MEINFKYVVQTQYIGNVGMGETFYHNDRHYMRVDYSNLSDKIYAVDLYNGIVYNWPLGSIIEIKKTKIKSEVVIQ